ncbi:MAG: hypothetical protein A2Y55_05435 [Actinobacteria bacterium RBG_16_68_12]|nr:MAG: hypothetical protein A2Y55_05435 [Actinobacteria bacterium RBG_16_68_12]
MHVVRAPELEAAPKRAHERSVLEDRGWNAETHERKPENSREREPRKEERRRDKDQRSHRECHEPRADGSLRSGRQLRGVRVREREDRRGSDEDR